MFLHAIEQSPFTDNLANKFFSNILADNYSGDCSFCATLRAILSERISTQETVRVTIFYASGEDSLGIKQLYQGPNSDDDSHMHVNFLNNISNKGFQQLDKMTRKMNPPYKYLADVSAYLSQKGRKIAVYSNYDLKRTLIHVCNISYATWHVIQSALPKLLPWYFEDSLSKFERELLGALTKEDAGNYLSLLRSQFRKFNLEETWIRKELHEFGLSYEKEQLRILKAEKEMLARKYNDLQLSIEKNIKKKRELDISILGIESGLTQDGDTGIASYFICNKRLHLISTDHNSLIYGVTVYLEYYDQHLYEKCAHNKSSYFYKNLDSTADIENFKQLLDALFGPDRGIKVRMCAEFNLILPEKLNLVNDSHFAKGMGDWLPHPHIDGYSCLGSNKSEINNRIREGDFIGAIEQSIAAVKNLNFADSIVVGSFIYTLQQSARRFLELPDGTVVSPKDALNWLQEKEVKSLI